MGKIRVIANPACKVARIGDDGRCMAPPNWVGWSSAVAEDGALVFTPMPDGQLVNDHVHYRRAAMRGECSIADSSQQVTASTEPSREV